MNDETTIAQRLNHASSVEDVWDSMVSHFHGLGFSGVAYLIFNRDSLHQSPIFFETGFPSALVETFEKLGYGRNAPVLRLALTKGTPLLAGQLDARQALSRAERVHREAMFAAGLKEALVLPAFGPLGRDAIAILGGAQTPDLYDRADWRDMQMTVQLAHLRGLELAPEDTPASGLSGREAEILELIARGKSNGVIADILSLSSATIDTYLRRVFEKLDVADRTSAAVKGVSLGLIRV